MDEAVKERRRQRHLNKTTRKPKVVQHVAPVRIGDGMKPNHQARQISIYELFRAVKKVVSPEKVADGTNAVDG